MAERIMTEQERLDFAAKAYGMEYTLEALRWTSIILSVVFIFLAVGSKTSRQETAAVWAFTVVLVVGTFGIWFRKTHAGYVVALDFFFVALCYPLFMGIHYRDSSVINYALHLLYFGMIGYGFWRGTAALVRLQSTSWDREMRQIDQWIEILKYPEVNPQVMEFDSESFWQGYNTYRILLTENYWVQMKFKMKSRYSRVGYRVLEKKDIRISSQANSTLRIAIKGKAIPELCASPGMTAELLRRGLT